jgi:hypothetical protein
MSQPPADRCLPSVAGHDSTATVWLAIGRSLHQIERAVTNDSPATRRMNRGAAPTFYVNDTTPPPLCRENTGLRPFLGGNAWPRVQDVLNGPHYAHRIPA